ncbi:MAG: hypothetical protein R3174_00140 [Gammaproteobacteria bacterium]|nr:hypothetical protein [Gammaproteobacteria bacterium]
MSEVSKVPLRDPDTVMRLERMGSFHQTRLSFMRVLLRRLERERWTFDRPVWRLDEAGEGVAVYRARGPNSTCSLVCFAHRIEPEERTDRVIAERWDSTFALVDGEPGEADLERLAGNVPRQEAGRCTQRELVLSRANKSVRLFEHVVDRLAAGLQPDAEQIESVGYLMRTTAVYGNGKFGVADRERIANRPEFSGPFQAELLTVWLIRAFTVDLAEHLARARSPNTAVPLDREIRRRLGVGNSTGLGMAPFLINHPSLLHTWMLTRESALARVRSLCRATPEAIDVFTRTLARSIRQVAGWRTVDSRQRKRIGDLLADLERLSALIAEDVFDKKMPWDALYRWGTDALSLEGQEMLVSLLIEPHGQLVDELADHMGIDEDASFRIDGTMPRKRILDLIEQNYRWAIDADFEGEESTARFWYVSEEKLEPRLGERYAEPGAELEQPLATGRDVASLYAALRQSTVESLAEFLIEHPEHRHAARRVQIAARFPYSEIRDNLISAKMVPIDLLRCKLSFFGATRFDPRSDRWVRITMYKDAPFPDELGQIPADDWAFPPAHAVPA